MARRSWTRRARRSPSTASDAALADTLVAKDEQGRHSLAWRLIEGWALLGGLVLLGLALMTSVSAIGTFFGAPVPGDFELTEVGIAIAVFAFLPYCQLVGANVTADIFTQALSPRIVGLLEALWALLAFGFGLLLLWRTSAGLLDYRHYEETTAILNFPIWIAFVPAVASLALLVAAAWMSFIAALRRRARRVEATSTRIDDGP